MEFEFKEGSLEAVGLTVGDKVVCTYSESILYLEGQVIDIISGFNGAIEFEDGLTYYDHRLVKFKPLKDEQPSIDPDVAIQRLESVMEYVNKKLDFLNSNGVQSFQLNEVKRLMNGE